jgi:hypothetical protein
MVSDVFDKCGVMSGGGGRRILPERGREVEAVEMRIVTNGEMTPASYSGDPGFESRAGDRQFRLRFSWFSSATPGKYRDSALKQTTSGSFHIVSNSLIIPLFNAELMTLSLTK